jgi:hypothetical protein
VGAAYVLALPVDDIVANIDQRIRKAYGETAALIDIPPHPQALRVLEGEVLQGGVHPIRLKHVFVDMHVAAPATVS